jgi:hypothetical protein
MVYIYLLLPYGLLLGFIEDFQRTAIWSVVIFMTGFAVMRMVNIATNGAPSSFYLGMFISEVVIILIGIKLLK